MTLKLCGFAVSNYYNKVKLQLLEKGVPFEEELVWTGKPDAATLARSPMGKVPFLDTADGPISESSACCEYIEAKYPQHPLIPADPLAAAKVRELIIYSELHIELVARQLYTEAFFGGTLREGEKDRIHKLLTRGIAAFARLAKFSPYIAGNEFTLADCAALAHLPVASSATKIIYGEDLLAAMPVRDYVKMLGERSAVQKVNADRKANGELMKTRKP